MLRTGILQTVIKRKLPSRFSEPHVTSTVGQSAPIHSDQRFKYSVDRCFGQTAYATGERFPEQFISNDEGCSIIDSSDSFGQMEELRSPSVHYGLSVEGPGLTVFVKQIKRKVSGGSFLSLTNGGP